MFKWPGRPRKIFAGVVQNISVENRCEPRCKTPYVLLSNRVVIRIRAKTIA